MPEKWKDERAGVLARLSDLEARVAALESAPVDPVDPVDPDEPITPVAPIETGTPNRDAAFESAWSAVMSGATGVQIAVVNPNDPRFNGGPFVVEDNKEKVIGEGDSGVAAFEAYVDAGGRRHGTAGSLSDFEYEQAEFFSKPGNVMAPTSCRHSNHGFECDFFRKGVTPAGGDKVGPFDAPGLAIEAMRKKLGADL